jgi:hypothetical protein
MSGKGGGSADNLEQGAFYITKTFSACPVMAPAPQFLTMQKNKENIPVSWF